MNITPRTKAALAATTLAALTDTGRAATITLNTSDALGTTSFNSGLHWSNNAAPSAANDYFVGSGLTLRTPSSQASNIVFAGNSLSLVDTATNNALLIIKNLTGTTTTVNNLTLDGGQVQNGGNGAAAATTVTFASNGITLGATAGGTFNGGATGRTLNVNAPIGGSGQLTLNTSNGLITLNAANNYAGKTTISGTAISAGVVAGSVRAIDGMNLPTTGNLALASGVLESGINLTRGLGTGAGQINLTGAAAGFSAVGGNVTVAIGGTASPTVLTWGSTSFNPSALVLNNANATGALTFANAIDLGTATRTLFNTGTAASSVTLAGGFGSETASAGMNFYGGGVTVLNTPNAFTGAVTIGSGTNGTTSATSGVVRAAVAGALGTGLVTIGNGGGGTTGRLELAGATSLFNAISLPQRSGPSAGIENVSGNNALTNTISVTSGGVYSIVQSDAGTLTLSGAIGAGGVAIRNAATDVRTATLQGAGNGTVSGVVANGSGTINLAKAGGGTWTLSNAANSYTGFTTLIGGTLATAALANGGVSSGIGASSNASSNLVMAGGTLQYTGASTATDRLFTVGAPGGTLDSSGGGAVTFANTAAYATAGPATNGTYTSGSNTITVTAGPIAGLIAGQTLSGTGIPAGAKITDVNYNSNTFTISANTTAAGTAAALTVGSTPVRTLTLTGSNAGNNAVNGALTNSAGGNVLAVAKTGGGTWVLGGADTYSGVTTVAGGTLKAAVASGAAGNLLTNAGGVNLGDAAGKLVLDYTAGGSDPVDSVKTILTNEYAAGGNSSAGFLAGRIRSSALSGSHTIGYADTGAGLVTIRVTLPGDADLNGSVDFNDFLTLQSNFGVSNTRFDQGNFNYDAVTDFNDFLVLQANFGTSIGFDVPAPTVTAAQMAAMNTFLSTANIVPEPAHIALLGVSFVGGLRRRRSPGRA